MTTRTILRNGFFALIALVGAMPSCGRDDGSTNVQIVDPSLTIRKVLNPKVGQCTGIVVERRDTGLLTLTVTTTGSIEGYFTADCSGQRITTSLPILFNVDEMKRTIYVKGIAAAAASVTVTGSAGTATLNLQVSSTDPGFH